MHDKDLMEAMARRRQMGLNSQMEPLSESDMSEPQHVAAMTQPKDLPAIPIPSMMVEHDEDESVETQGEEEKEEPMGHAKIIHDALDGGYRPKSLRGRAMTAYDDKRKELESK